MLILSKHQQQHKHPIRLTVMIHIYISRQVFGINRKSVKRPAKTQQGRINSLYTNWCKATTTQHGNLKVALDPVTYSHFRELSMNNYDNSNTKHCMIVCTPVNTVLRLQCGEIISVTMTEQKESHDVQCTVAGIQALRGRTGQKIHRAMVTFSILT